MPHVAEDVLAVASGNILEVRIYIDTYVDMEDRFFSFGVHALRGRNELYFDLGPYLSL